MDANLFLQNHGVITVENPEYNPKSKKNKVPRTIDIVDLNADRNQLQEIVAQDLLNQDRVSVKEARKYEKYGINWNPKDAANGSLDVQLAEAQSNWAKLGNALAQTVVSEIGLGTALGISDLFDAIGQAVGASDHDYNNPVSAKLAEWQDKFNNEVAPIYSRPGTGFGNGTDFGWWMQNIPSIASSLTLLIPAAGGTKLLSMAGKAALKTTKAGAKWLEKATRLDRIHKAGHSVGISSRAYETGKLFAKNATTAALSRTMENYQEARQVYNDMYVDVLDSLNTMSDEEYNNFLNRNQNTVKDVDTSNKDEVAKAVARKSSDLTFKADYANTVFDIIELYALRNVAFHGFRNSKVSAAARRLDKNARRFAGKYKTIGELEELVSKQSFGRKAADKLGDIFYAGRTVGMAQASEGIEEAVNYIAQQEGMEVGKSMLSMEANTTFSNRLRQYMNNPELWESAFWGVAGGIVFQGAGSGLARAKTALERKNEKKKNKPDEKTGEDVNANTKWKDLWELPDVKRVKASIENRLAIENDYQDNVKRILDDNDMATEEKEILLQSLRERRRTDLALNAMDSGTIDMLKGYLEDDNVKQALIDKGVVSKEEADNIQAEDIEAIQKVQDRYDDNVRKLNAISREINAKNGTNIPTEYLQIIARNNINAQLTVENFQKQLASWSDDAANLQNDLEENGKIDKNINYKEAIRLRWLSEKLGQLEADKKELLGNKKAAKSISGQERLKELDDNINLVRKQVAELNPENQIENLLFVIQTSLGYEKFNGEYLETGRRKEYQDFTSALMSKDAKYFEKLDSRLAGIEERHFGAKEVLDQNMARALAKSETNINNISKELGTAYSTLAALEYMIDAQRNNIKLTNEEVEQEARHLYNYMNEVRKQKILDSKEALKGLADKYGSENIRNLVTQRYNGQSLDYNNINISDDDKQLLNDTLDTLHLDEKLNSDLASDIDVMLATHDEVKAAQDARRKSETVENFSASQEPILDTNNQNRDNPSPLGQQPEKTANPVQNEANKAQTNPQPSRQQSPNPSGLNIAYVSDEVVVKQNGNYQYLATDNPNYFKVDFTVDSANVKHFNNYNLFTQEQGVDLTADNYIIGKKPIIDTKGNVIEKGTLVLNTPENNEQANTNSQEDDIEKNNAAEARTSSLPTDMNLVSNTNGGRVIEEQLASTGEVVKMQPSPEQVAGIPEEKLAEDTSRLAEMPYDANDVKSRASQDMLAELGDAIANNKDIDWNNFRKRLNTKYQPEGSTSQAITKDIESVIRAGKSKAERRGIKSFDAVVDAMAKASRLKEDTSNVEAQQGFSESVNKLIDVFNSEVGIDIIGGRKFINIEALCRYCDKILNDKLSAGLLLNNLIDLVDKDKSLVVTDTDTTNIDERLRRTLDSVNTRDTYLGIDYGSVLRQKENATLGEKEAFYEVIDNLQPGDNIEIEREEKGLSFKVNGITIGNLPYPNGPENGPMYQTNNNWKTDIQIEQGGTVKSKLMDLYISWATDITNPDIKELNDIILEYAYTGDADRKRELIKKFRDNKEVKKAIAAGYTVENPDYSILLDGIARIWRYTRSDGNAYDGNILDIRKREIIEWFTDKVSPSFAFIQKLRYNPNLKVEVNSISEGDAIITRDSMRPVSKAIGTNHKGKVRLGVVQKLGNITLAGNGINGSNNLIWRKANTGSTFVVIPSRNGNHAYIQAFPQKANSTSLSKTAKDIKNAIYSEIRRICNDQTASEQEKAKSLESFLRQVLPVYTRGTNRTDDTVSFFRRDIQTAAQINISTNYYNNAPNGYTIRINNVYYNVFSSGIVKQGTTNPSIESLAETIINGIEEHCVFNLSYSAFNSDLGFAERQNLTKRGKNGEFVISIPNQQDFTFASYNDFVLENDIVQVRTQPTDNGRNNFNRLTDNPRTTQQLTVKISNDISSPVEENVQESTTTSTIANPREAEILEVFNNKRITNKAEKLANLLFGKKLKKRFSFGKKEYTLFPKNIIFVDENLGVNALTNTTNRPIISETNSNLIIMPGTVALGKEWMEMATSSNPLERKQAVKKLIHEQLHILLSGENQKYIEQIREVFDEFAEKNTNPDLNKYLFKEYEKDYYTDGKLNQEGLEEFLVESLTSNELAEGLNSIETTPTKDSTKKESLFQKIMKLLAKILGIDIKEGTLYEKEFKLLRDVLDTNKQTGLQFDEASEDIATEIAKEETQPATESEVETENTNDDFLSFLENNDFSSAIDNMIDESNGADAFKNSRLRENTSPSISSYVSSFPIEEQPKITNQIENGEISVSCK